MKKILILSMMAFFAISTAMAQTPEDTSSQTTRTQVPASRAITKDVNKKNNTNTGTPGLDKFNSRHQAALEKAEKEKAEKQNASGKDAKETFGNIKDDAEASMNANAPKPIINWVKKNYPGYWVYAWGNNKEQNRYDVTITNNTDSKVIYFTNNFEYIDKGQPKLKVASQNSSNQQNNDKPGSKKTTSNNSNQNNSFTPKPKSSPK